MLWLIPIASEWNCNPNLRWTDERLQVVRAKCAQRRLKHAASTKARFPTMEIDHDGTQHGTEARIQIHISNH
jgi:hypothetical protein